MALVAEMTVGVDMAIPPVRFLFREVLS
jgi:hypothetical protein